MTAHIQAPPRLRIDQEPVLTAAGLPAGGRVVLAVSAADGSGARWTSESPFIVAADGSVDTSRDAPVEPAPYGGADAWGPFWTMAREGSGFFVRSKPTPIRYQISVSAGGEELASADLERHFGLGLLREPLEQDGLVGTLYLPAGDEAHPAVILMGGSDGACPEAAAALLADEGYACLALAYFGVEDRPATLVGIELDDVDRSISWLLAHPRTTGAEVALVGISRGAELALQVAADNHRVGAVVAVAPSALRQPGLTSDFSDFTHAAWHRSAVPLPFNPGKLGVKDWAAWTWRTVRRQPMRQVGSFRADLRDPESIRRARIPVEQCRGPVLLISGLADQLWPSAEFADLIQDAWPQREDHRRDLRQLRYPDVGHFVGFPAALPGLPPSIELRPTSFFSIDFGGQPAAHAAAAVDCWEQQRGFLAAWAEQLTPDQRTVPVGADQGRTR